MTNYLVALENGEEIPPDQNAVKEIFGNTAYQDFKQTEKILLIIVHTKLIYTILKLEMKDQ